MNSSLIRDRLGDAAVRTIQKYGAYRPVVIDPSKLVVVGVPIVDTAATATATASRQTKRDMLSISTDKTRPQVFNTADGADNKMVYDAINSAMCATIVAH